MENPPCWRYTRTHGFPIGAHTGPSAGRWSAGDRGREPASAVGLPAAGLGPAWPRLHDAVPADGRGGRRVGDAHRGRALRGAPRDARAPRPDGAYAGAPLPGAPPRRGERRVGARERPHPPPRPPTALPPLPAPLPDRGGEHVAPSVGVPGSALAPEAGEMTGEFDGRDDLYRPDARIR